MALSRATYYGDLSVDNVYYITLKGSLSYYSSANESIGICPMIVLLSNTKLLSGDGTKTNPYIITN